MSDNKEKLTAYERWELPNLGAGDTPRKQAPAGIAIKSEEAVEVTEDIDEASLVYEPLTAQQLEEIRLAAYDEGFAQGQEEGLAKGHEEGLVQGHEVGQKTGLEQGFEEGKTAALTQGIEQAQAQIGQLESLLNEVLSEFEKPLEETRQRIEALLQSATKRIVEHVVRRELSEDSEQMIQTELSKVLAALGDQEGRATLTVHPHSLECVEALASDQRLHIKIKTDASLIEGGFILESQSFYVDGRVESRLKDVLNALDKPH